MTLPSKYRVEFCILAVNMGKEGKSPAQIAAACGVCRQTIDNWAQSYPEWDAALRLSKTYAQAHWEEIAYQAISDKSVNAPILLKCMQARFRTDYTERRELTGPEGGAIENITRIELVAGRSQVDCRFEDDQNQIIDVTSSEQLEGVTTRVIPLLSGSEKNELSEQEVRHLSDAELLAAFDANADSVDDNLTDREQRRLTRLIMKRTHEREAEQIRNAAAARECERQNRPGVWRGKRKYDWVR